ncbi:hypothetical protein D4764_02G0005510 [Takifugu flavidus]|uniref:Uncharacterized protein n=1 Tax=Takifugu flavidus TaxID=433684 RepID=A0A5C6NMU6_9TELE|nr:hypothetical protein D4764_02G0005510 [Takifugu flavidus]
MEKDGRHMLYICAMQLLGGVYVSAGRAAVVPPHAFRGGQVNVGAFLHPSHMRSGIVMDQEEPRSHCTSVGSDNRSQDFIPKDFIT